MTAKTASDLVWGSAARVSTSLKDPKPLTAAGLKYEVCTYIEDHLEGEDGIDVEASLTESETAFIKGRIQHWLQRMLGHKRFETKSSPDAGLKEFIEVFFSELERAVQDF